MLAKIYMTIKVALLVVLFGMMAAGMITPDKAREIPRPWAVGVEP